MYNKSRRNTLQRCLGVHVNFFWTLNILIVPRKLTWCTCQYSLRIVYHCESDFIVCELIGVLNLLIITTRLTFFCASFSVLVQDSCPTVDQFQTSKNKHKYSIIA